MLLRALEEKRFSPLGSDREVKSNFQLICGTNRDLFALAAQGRFRSDLLARLNLWTFRLPGLTERPEDIAPNLSYELERAAGEIGHLVRFNKEAQEKFLSLATSPQASWSGNFRDLAGAVTRMAVLSTSGRITVPLVEEEWQRLQQNWHAQTAGPDKDLELLTEILGEKVQDLDLFDVPQLALVIRTCREQKSLSAAGRVLFAHAREERKTKNDGDRLRKYLARFDLTWEAVTTSR